MTSSDTPSRRQKYKVGDLVHFVRGRKIDWTVVGVIPPASVGQPQTLVLESGMSGRVMSVSAEHVIPRPTRAYVSTPAPPNLQRTKGT